MTHAEHFSGLNDIYQTSYDGTQCFLCNIKGPNVKCKGSSCSDSLSFSYDFNDIKRELRKLGWIKVRSVSEIGRSGIYGVCPKCVRSIKKTKIS